jgi:hypothetical protein
MAIVRAIVDFLQGRARNAKNPFARFSRINIWMPRFVLLFCVVWIAQVHKVKCSNRVAATTDAHNYTLPLSPVSPRVTIYAVVYGNSEAVTNEPSESR